MKNRQLNNYISQVGHAGTLKNNNLQLVAEDAGCGSFYASIKAACNEAGERLILQELHDAIVGYSVIELFNRDDIIKSVDDTLVRRTYSAMRFKCILIHLDMQLSLGSRFFKVISRKSGTFDVIFICNDGALAATSEFYAVHGYPGKHILAVFVAGFMAFNPVRHIHPTLLAPHTQFLNPFSVHGMTVKSRNVPLEYKLINVSDEVVWDLWIQKTESEWKRHGLGDGEFDTLLMPTISSIRQQRDTKQEHMKKITMFLLHSSLLYTEEEKYLLEYYEIVKERLATKGKIRAKVSSNNMLLNEPVAHETLPTTDTVNTKAVTSRSRKRKPNIGTI